MKTTLIVNAHGGSAGGAGDVILRRAGEHGWSVLPVEPHQALEAARSAASQGAELVVAGGGDGTVSAVAEGVAGTGAALGVLPLGTGNDLARSLSMPLDVGLAFDVLAAARPQALLPLDLMEVVTEGSTELVVNAVNGGVASSIRELMDEELKVRLGPLAFIWAGLESLTRLEQYAVTYRADGGPPRDVEVVSFIIANSGSVGGGLKVAPTARLDDGLLDLVLVRADASIAELTMAAVRARFGDIFASGCVEHVQVRQLELVKHGGLPFTVDGEALGSPLRSVRVRPGALRAVVGPTAP